MGSIPTRVIRMWIFVTELGESTEYTVLITHVRNQLYSLSVMQNSPMFLYVLFSAMCCSEYDPEQFAGTRIPVLVVGTKHDQLDSTRQTKLQTSVIAEECGADEINLVSFLFKQIL